MITGMVTPGLCQIIKEHLHSGSLHIIALGEMASVKNWDITFCGINWDETCFKFKKKKISVPNLSKEIKWADSINSAKALACEIFSGTCPNIFTVPSSSEARSESCFPCTVGAGLGGGIWEM